MDKDKKTNTINLSNFGGGSLEELFQNEIQKIIDNIKDPNTKAESKRELNIKIVFKPTENRTAMQVETNVKSKLAMYKGFAINAYVVHDPLFDYNIYQEDIDFSGKVKSLNNTGTGDKV